MAALAAMFECVSLSCISAFFVYFVVFLFFALHAIPIVYFCFARFICITVSLALAAAFYDFYPSFLFVRVQQRERVREHKWENDRESAGAGACFRASRQRQSREHKNLLVEGWKTVSRADSALAAQGCQANTQLMRLYFHRENNIKLLYYVSKSLLHLWKTLALVFFFISFQVSFVFCLWYLICSCVVWQPCQDTTQPLPTVLAGQSQRVVRCLPAVRVAVSFSTLRDSGSGSVLV